MQDYENGNCRLKKELHLHIKRVLAPHLWHKWISGSMNTREGISR